MNKIKLAERPAMQPSLFEEGVFAKQPWPTWSVFFSADSDQDKILRSIMLLYNEGEPFELDATYSKGVFYRHLPQPTYKYDVAPQAKGVAQADARCLPHEDNSIGSIVFDPPFKASNSKVKGIIEGRFSAFSSPETLWAFYYDAMGEFMRVLKPGGILVFKCQDTVSSGKQYWSHREVERYGEELGFAQLDFFVLLAKGVIMSPNMRNQIHSRKNCCYIVVFKKKK